MYTDGLCVYLEYCHIPPSETLLCNVDRIVRLRLVASPSRRALSQSIELCVRQVTTARQDNLSSAPLPPLRLRAPAPAAQPSSPRDASASFRMTSLASSPAACFVGGADAAVSAPQSQPPAALSTAQLPMELCSPLTVSPAIPDGSKSAARPDKSHQGQADQPADQPAKQADQTSQPADHSVLQSGDAYAQPDTDKALSRATEQRRSKAAALAAGEAPKPLLEALAAMLAAAALPSDAATAVRPPDVTPRWNGLPCNLPDAGLTVGMSFSQTITFTSPDRHMSASSGCSTCGGFGSEASSPCLAVTQRPTPGPASIQIAGHHAGCISITGCNTSSSVLC